MQTRRIATIVMVVAVLTLLQATSSTVAGPPVEGGKGSGEITLAGKGGPAAPDINAAGAPFGSNFPISELSGDQVRPAVAYNSQQQEYLVVYQNEWTPKSIYGQRVAKNGSRFGPPFNVFVGPGDGTKPAVVYNSQHNQYLAVWKHNGPYEWGIRGVILSATGTPLSGQIRIMQTNVPTSDYDQPAVAYAYTADRYLVVFRFNNLSGGKSILGQALMSDGSLDGISFEVVPYTADRLEHLDLAYNRARNEFLVVWQQAAAIFGNWDIYGRRVKMAGGAGVLGGSIALSTLSNEETAPAVAAIPIPAGLGQYLVVFEQRYTPSDRDIMARQVAGDGSLGLNFAISTAAEDQSNPAVAGNESAQQYLVAWTQSFQLLANTTIHGMAFSMGGNAMSQDTVLGGLFGDHAAVASGWGGDYLAAFDDQPLLGDRDIYGQLWGNRLFLPLVVKNH